MEDKPLEEYSDEHSEKSYLSMSDSSGVLLSNGSEITNESKNSDEIDIMNDIISIGTFFILSNDINTEFINVDESISIDKKLTLRCNKLFSLKDNVIINLNSNLNISKYKIIFEGGTIVFEDNYNIKRTTGNLVFKNTKLIFKTGYQCYNDIFENVNIENLCSDTILTFNNKNNITLSNVSINVKYNVNIIFKINNIGNIYFSNCKILGNCDVNYGIYVTINRLNNEIDINDTDLGEKTINYKNQYIFYEYMLGLFKSSRIPSYVACSNCNLDVYKKSNNIHKTQTETLREIKFCFGTLNNSFVSLKKTILESEIFDINDLNKISNNSYFGVLDKNFINPIKQKYFSIQYNFPNTRKLYCGNVKCQITFTSQDNHYVLPKPIVFKIIDEDEQILSLNHQLTDNTKSYIIYENINTPLSISYKYENILPVKTLLHSNYNSKEWINPIETYISQNLTICMNIEENTIINDIEYNITANSILGHDNNKFKIRNKNKNCSILVSLNGIEYKYNNDKLNLLGVFNGDFNNIKYISYIDFYVMLKGDNNIKLEYDIDNNIKIELLNNELIYVSNEPQHIFMKLYIEDIINFNCNNDFKIKIFSKNISPTYICGNIIQECKSFIKYKDKYYSDDFVIEERKNEPINYDIILPYRIDKELNIKQTIHSNISNSYVLHKKMDKFTNQYTYNCSFDDDFVYGMRNYIIETELENHKLPKIIANVSETSQRGFDVYINNKHIIEIFDTENKFTSCKLKFNQILNNIVINNKNVKIKGYIKLKSNFITSFKLILIGNNNLRLSLDNIKYNDRITLEFNNKLIEFYIDLSNTKKDTSTILLTSYFLLNKQNKTDYETIEFDNYSFITIKTFNTSENILCSSINLGNWMIECDNENLIFKKRDIDTINYEDFKIIKQINSNTNS